MAALTADRHTRRKDDHYASHPDSYPVLADAIIYYGALVIVDAAGFLKPLTAGDNRAYAMVALQYVNNTGGANGDVLCKAEFGAAYHYPVDGGGLDRSDVGSLVYGMDDGTVRLADGGSDTPVGRISYYEDATTAWITVKGPRG